MDTSSLELVRGELPKLNEKAIERAVSSFVSSVDVHGDLVGFYNQTIKSIYHAIYNGNGEFWLAHEAGEVLGYVMARIAVDVDDQLCYWLSQAWLHPNYRGKKEVKNWWQKIRSHAKQRLCKHIMVISARNNEAYCRWLGKGWHEYATILKEDI